MNKLMTAAVALSVFTLVGCSIEVDEPLTERVATTTEAATTTPSTSTTSTTPKPSKNEAVTTLPAFCTATPPGGFGLTRVDVGPAAGHPDGAQSVKWTFTGTPPTTGTIIFSWQSGGIQRAVKVNDGQVIANYVFHAKTAKQDNIEMAPVLDEHQLVVAVPAAYADELGKTWTATIEVGGTPAGECAPH